MNNHDNNLKFQGRSKLDNWGGGGADIHIFGFGTINFFYLKSIVFMVCEVEYMNISPLPNYRARYGPEFA